MSLTHRIWLRAALVAAPAALGGCAGAQAGGQTGEETDDGCVFSLSELARQERSPLGFSAEQVLEFAEGEQQATFSWLSASDFRYGPESGEGQVTLRTTAAGSAQFARVAATHSAAHCDDHLSVPVHVALTTAGGALDESFTAKLLATTSDQATLAKAVPASELGGLLAFDPETLGGKRFVRLEIDLRLRPEGSAGAVLAGIESGDPNASAAGAATGFQSVPLACWGTPSLTLACPD